MYEVPGLDATYNHLYEFIEIAGFEEGLQNIDPGSNFGGQREEESGYYYNIMETDNTLECIWVWSRYHEITGESTYDQNIDNAWIYAYNYPAWLEGAGYYSAHNCAWALAAELQYRTTFNDSAHWDYAVNSANYILQTELSFTSSLNVMVTGWCCGNLYLYGEATGNQQYMDVACERARDVIEWVEADPANRLAMESWAMSSGTFVWGVCNSLFKRYPDMGVEWLATYGPMVQVYEPTAGGWSNAWNVAYCNAQEGMFDVTGDSTYFWNQLDLTTYLLHNDPEHDGGIPASASGSIDMDASWTTAYLAMMGCNPHIETGVDAGVLLVLSPRQGITLTVGQAVPVAAMVGNWCLNDITDAMVTVSGALTDTVFVDIGAGMIDRIFIDRWTPLIPGPDSIRFTIYADGDTVEFNNSDVSYFNVNAAGEDLAAEPLQIQSTPDGSRLMYDLPENGSVNLKVYDLQGRLVDVLVDEYQQAGPHQINWQGKNVSSGVYFVRLQTKNNHQVSKIIITN